MEYDVKLIQNQKQQFSPKLIPSLKILQMGYYDLEKMIDETLVDNPFSDIEYSESIEIEEKEYDFKTVHKHNDEDLMELEIRDQEQDLLLSVMMQLEHTFTNAKQKRVIEFLVQSLDSKGYLSDSLDEIQHILDLNEEQMKAYLTMLQSVEPYGLGARDLQECLSIQLARYNKQNTLAQRLVADYLPTIGERNYEYIVQKEQVCLEEVMEAVTLIKSLNPIPANGFSRKEKVNYIVPDVYVDEDDGKLVITLNCRYEQKLKMNTDHLEIYKKGVLDKADKQFLSQKLKDFNWLLYSTSRRSLTLHKIMSVLAQYQETYLLTGDKKRLKPVRLKDLEELSGMHRSTISRTLHDKYFHSKFGTYPLKLLVPRSYFKEGKPNASKETIKEEIKLIIQNEDKHNPLSDQQIQTYLMEEGYPISRRSVTLYREQMHLLKARFRKE